jgi:hypothetical protein
MTEYRDPLTVNIPMGYCATDFEIICGPIKNKDLFLADKCRVEARLRTKKTREGAEP